MPLTKISTPAIKDEAITLAKLLHGDSNSNGKFLKANNGADPTFETIENDKITEGNSTAEIIDAGTGQFKVALDGTDSTFTVNPTSTVFGRSGSNQAVQIFGSLQFTLGSGVQPYLRLTSGGNLEVTGAYNGGSSIGQVWEFGGYQGTHISGGNIKPSADSTYDLGTNTVRWQNVYGDSLNASNNIKIPNDTGKVELGTGADFKIFHDATDNIIQAYGSPKIRLRHSATDGNNVKNAIVTIADGAVELYHNNSKKFETTSAGATVTGALTATGDITAFSDETLKTDITTINNALNIVSQLRGVSYKWKKDNEPSIGVIAQEVEKVIPEIVHKSEYEGKEVKSVAYGKIIGFLIEAIKELKTEVDTLKGAK